MELCATEIIKFFLGLKVLCDIFIVSVLIMAATRTLISIIHNLCCRLIFRYSIGCRPEFLGIVRVDINIGFI